MRPPAPMPCWWGRGWSPPATPARPSPTWSPPGPTPRPPEPPADPLRRPGPGARDTGPMTTTSLQPPGERVLPARPGWPDATGHFGVFGGRFVPEALIAALDELTEAYEAMRIDPVFLDKFDRLQRDYTGRPSPLTEVERFAEHAGGARILLKREDLNHTGSHKINNVLGQAL